MSTLQTTDPLATAIAAEIGPGRSSVVQVASDARRLAKAVREALSDLQDPLHHSCPTCSAPAGQECAVELAVWHLGRYETAEQAFWGAIRG